MTVKELQEILSLADPDSEVFVNDVVNQNNYAVDAYIDQYNYVVIKI